ncbi:MAG: hypothetical protein OK439_05130 [Thaumarchaeota archaeon]|nr:hypothetical protein [Nitrososphaerota archaeon]
MILVRRGRITLCRIAIGMSGMQISKDSPTVEDIFKNGFRGAISIAYDNLKSLKVSEDPESNARLEMSFLKGPSMEFMLDTSQFESLKTNLPKITAIADRVILQN